MPNRARLVGQPQCSFILQSQRVFTFRRRNGSADGHSRDGSTFQIGWGGPVAR